ncbi:hypothetical protein IW262DRAFT_1004258 [Armillaria fumosa]|nr:hypothetical protein IW262DRAFT_1004258 [Armillaria fumosa]
MDKALDDIITSRPRGIRRTGRRGSAKTQVVGTTGPNPAVKAKLRSAPATPASQQPADKIIVSNLPPDVNEAQVKELFHSTVGPLREVTLHYDSNGRSKGVASVHFQRKGDGTSAYNQYNNRLIDGKKPMKIEIVVDPSRPQQTLASRVAPSPVVAAATRTGGAPRGRRGRGGKSRKEPRPAKTAADLDAEMEDYTASNAATS